MFAKETDELVEQLVDAEYKNACEIWGETYSDSNTAEEVLREEIDEAYKEAYNMHLYRNTCWYPYTDKIEAFANNAIKELAQVLAVIRKIRNSRGKGK